MILPKFTNLDEPASIALEKVEATAFDFGHMVYLVFRKPAGKDWLCLSSGHSIKHKPTVVETNGLTVDTLF